MVNENIDKAVWHLEKAMNYMQAVNENEQDRKIEANRELVLDIIFHLNSFRIINGS